MTARLNETMDAFQVRLANCQELLRHLRPLLSAIGGDLADMSRLLKDDATLPEKNFAMLADRLGELAQYASEIKTAVRRKRQDGIEADQRIDALIGAVQ